MTFYRAKSKQNPEIHIIVFPLTFIIFELTQFRIEKTISKKLHNVAKSRDFVVVGTHLHIVFLSKRKKQTKYESCYINQISKNFISIFQ